MKNERSLPGDDVTIICSNPTHSGRTHLGRRGWACQYFGYYSLWDRISVKRHLTGKSCLTNQFYPINRNLRTNMKSSMRVRAL